MTVLITLFACALTSEAVGKVPAPEGPAAQAPDDNPTGKPPVKPDPPDNRPVRTKPSPSGPFEKVEVTDPSIGGTRTAWVKVPTGPGPWPVLLAFHGGKGRDGTDMDGKIRDAEDKGILLVYPNGGPTSQGSGWTGPDKDDGVDPMRDVLFVNHLLDMLEKKYSIDKDRVYAVGHSGGAYMVDLLWCTSSERIAGFGLVSRAMPIEMAKTCDVKVPRPYALVIGTNDDGVVNEYQMSFSDTRNFVISKLGCNKAPDDTRTLPDKGDSLSVEHAHWACRDGSTFDYYEVEGGGHSWPGAGKPRPDKSTDLDATKAFMRAFGLP